MKIRLLSPVPRYSEQLQISKDARKIEDQTNTKLISLVGQLQKLQIQPLDTVYNLDFRERVNGIFRRGIEQIYQIAASHAAEFTKRDYFTTRADLDKIEGLAQSYVDIFYSRLQRFIIPGNTQEKQIQIRPEYIVKLTTATMTQDTMRQAIIAKSQQILREPTITTAALADTQTVYVWITSQDDRVCPICQGYEGQAWNLDDYADIPEIPDDSHPNCRCTIQLSEAESF